MNLEPGPEVGGPVSMSQEEGASTDVIGMEVFSRAEMTAGKGSRRGPLKEEPKMASAMWSVSWGAEGKSCVNGTFRLRSWVERRWMVELAKFDF